MKKPGSFLMAAAMKCISKVICGHLNETGSPQGWLSATAGLVFGMADDFTGNRMSAKAEELIVFQKLKARLSSGDPHRINHQLKKIFQEAAVLSVSFVRKMHLTERKEAIDTTDLFVLEELRHYEKKVAAFIESKKEDLATLVSEYDFQETDIVDSGNFISQVVDELFSEEDEASMPVKAYYSKMLPYCFDLVFAELLRNNDAAFKSFQLWLLTDLHLTIRDLAADVHKMRELGQLIFETLQEIQSQYSFSKAEIETERRIFLDRQDDLERLIIQLHAQRKDENDASRKAEHDQQIRANERLQIANEGLIKENEAALKQAEEKFQKEITTLLQQVRRLETELAIQKEFSKQLHQIQQATSPIPGIKELLSANDLQAVIDFPINNPAYTLRDTAEILLIKANVCASSFRLEEAEQYFNRSIATLEYKDNLVAWNRYLYTKRDWEQCRLVTLKALLHCDDAETKIAMVSLLLTVYWKTNRNEDAIQLGGEYLADLDTGSIPVLHLHLLYLVYAANLMCALDKEKGRVYCEKIIDTKIDAGHEERDLLLFLQTGALIAIGDSYYDYRVISDIDYESDSGKALYYFLEAEKSLSDVGNQDTEDFILLLMSVNTRLASLQKNDQQLYLKRISVSNNVGNYILANKNEVHLEFAANIFGLVNFYKPSDPKKSTELCVLLMSLSNIIETGNDGNRDQNLFYIHYWLLALLIVRGRSAVLDETLSKITALFEKAAPQAPNEFLYHGTTFLRFAASRYHNNGDKKAYDYYEKLFVWLGRLAEKRPERFTPDLCDQYINQATKFMNDNDFSACQATLQKATEWCNKINPTGFKYRQLKNRIWLAEIMLAINTGDQQKAREEMDLFGQHIKQFTLEPVFEQYEEQINNLKYIARMYAVPKPGTALEYLQAAYDLVIKTIETFGLDKKFAQGWVLMQNNLKEIYEQAAEIHFSLNDAKKGKEMFLAALQISKYFVQEVPQMKQAMLSEYCNDLHRLGDLLSRQQDPECIQYLSEAIQIAEPYKGQPGVDWADTVIEKSTMLIMAMGMVHGFDSLGVKDNLGDGFQFKQMELGFSSAIVVAGMSIQQGKYKETAVSLRESINMFHQFLTPSGKIKLHEYFFQMSFLLKAACYRGHNFAEAEKAMSEAYAFSKYILSQQKKEDKQFVIVCEHYQDALDQVLQNAGMFSKSKVKSRIKDIYTDMKKTADSYPLTDPEEIGNFQKMMDKMFALI